MTTLIDTTDITYNRETKDYDVTDRGEYITSASTYREAEQKRTAYLASRGADGITYDCADYDFYTDANTPEVAARIAVAMGEQAPFTDVCPSCGDQLAWEGPSLCGACQEAGERYEQLVGYYGPQLTRQL